MYKVNVKLGNIVEECVDAIVNAANVTLLGGGGVDGAIHAAAGPCLLEECRKIPSINGFRCNVGEAKITSAGNLDCLYVIHTVGPRVNPNRYKSELWEDFPCKELYNSWTNCLKLANENNLNTISFPSISTGAYLFPVEKAASIAFVALINFYLENKETSIKQVNIVTFSEEDYNSYSKNLSLLNIKEMGA